MLAALLHDAVRALRPTAALHVALVYRHAGRHADRLVRVVSEFRVGVVGAALSLLSDTAGALTPHNSILVHSKLDTFTGQVVIDVAKISHLQRNKMQDK